MPSIADLNAKYANAPTPTRTPPPAPGFWGSVGQGIKNSVTGPFNLAKGLVKEVGSLGQRVGVSNPVRAVQAIPDVARSVKHELQGNQAAAQSDLAGADAVMKAPLGGNRTMAGSTPLQNLGDAAQIGSFALGGGSLNPMLEATLIGTAQGAGNYASNSNNPTVMGLLGNTAVGAGAGAVGGAVVGALTPEVSETSSNAANEVISSRIKDATPEYNKSMVGEHISAPLEEGKTIPRVNEGQGFMGKRTVNTSAQEQAVGEELGKIENYPDKGTALQKSQTIHDTIGQEAENLKKTVQEEDKTRPLSSKAKDIVYKNVLENMNRDARDVVITRGKGDAAGAQERAGTVVGRYAQDVAHELTNYDGTRTGILELRKNLDEVYKDARGNSAFGSEHRNALDEMHSNIRDYLNRELNESTQSVNTKLSLEKQAKLFRAKDVLDVKAEAEATSHYGRILQQHPELRRVVNVLARQGIMLPLKILLALAGATALVPAATKEFKKLSGK